MVAAGALGAEFGGTRGALREEMEVRKLASTSLIESGEGRAVAGRELKAGQWASTIVPVPRGS